MGLVAMGLGSKTLNACLPFVATLGRVQIFLHHLSEIRTFFIIVTSLAWITTFALSMCYLTNCNNVLKQIKWNLVEFVHSALFALLCSVAGIVQVIGFHACSIYSVAATFSFFLAIAYGFNAFLMARQFLSTIESKEKNPEN